MGGCDVLQLSYDAYTATVKLLLVLIDGYQALRSRFLALVILDWRRRIVSTQPCLGIQSSFWSERVLLFEFLEHGFVSSGLKFWCSGPMKHFIIINLRAEPTGRICRPHASPFSKSTETRRGSASRMMPRNHILWLDSLVF